MTLEIIKETVERLTEQKIDRQCRDREVVYARAMYFKLAKQYTNYPLNKIGKIVNRHHASVIHGIKLFDDVIAKYETDYYQIYDRITLNLKKRQLGSLLNPALYYREKYARTLLELRKERHKSMDLKEQLINNLI